MTKRSTLGSPDREENCGYTALEGSLGRVERKVAFEETAAVNRK